MTVGVSLCAGTLAVELYQLCRLGPLTGFMGSKRRWAAELGAAVYGDTKPERLIVVDAGPWGDVWKTLADPTQRARVVERLLKLDAQGTLKDLWPELVAEAPSEDAARRVAQYLCVQSRVSNSLPVWWEPGEAERDPRIPENGFVMSVRHDPDGPPRPAYGLRGVPSVPLDVSIEGGGLRHQPSQQPGRPSTPRAVQGNPPPPTDRAAAGGDVRGADEGLRDGAVSPSSSPAQSSLNPATRRGRRRSCADALGLGDAREQDRHQAQGCLTAQLARATKGR